MMPQSANRDDESREGAAPREQWTGRRLARRFLADAGVDSGTPCGVAATRGEYGGREGQLCDIARRGEARRGSRRVQRKPRNTHRSRGGDLPRGPPHPRLARPRGLGRRAPSEADRGLKGRRRIAFARSIVRMNGVRQCGSRAVSDVAVDGTVLVLLAVEGNAEAMDDGASGDRLNFSLPLSPPSRRGLRSGISARKDNLFRLFVQSGDVTCATRGPSRYHRRAGSEAGPWNGRTSLTPSRRAPDAPAWGKKAAPLRTDTLL